jgi:hypothetical protein
MALVRPYDYGTRVQALILLQKKTPMAQIVKDTGYTERTIYGIQKKAKD